MAETNIQRFTHCRMFERDRIGEREKKKKERKIDRKKSREGESV